MSGHGEHESIVDPRHVFLTSAEVMARYRWGRTKGYEVSPRLTTTANHPLSATDNALNRASWAEASRTFSSPAT
jgi:hypothetical protein